MPDLVEPTALCRRLFANLHSKSFAVLFDYRNQRRPDKLAVRGMGKDLGIRPARIRYCVNTVSTVAVLTQRFMSILIFLCRLRLFAITPGSFRPCHPGPDEFVCFGLGPVAHEQFRSQRFGHDKDSVRASQPIEIQFFLRNRLLAGGFATQLSFAKCKA